jgi:quercetin dioxygenase-like cupin family protein
MTAAPPEIVHLPAVAGSGGVVWSVSPQGFHANLVVLGPSEEIPPHQNDAVDVLLVVLAGAGRVTVDDDPVAVNGGDAVLIPRGALRSIAAGEDELRYLTVHDRREPLTIGSARGSV